jgi:predicted Zn-dependent protease
MQYRYLPYLVLSILLFLFPFVLAQDSYLTIGVLSTDGIEYSELRYVVEGLEKAYGDIANIILITDYKVPLTGLESREWTYGKQYETRSFNDLNLSLIRDQYDLDLILIVTQHDVSSWRDRNWNFLFGEADPSRGSAVMSTFRLKLDNPAEKRLRERIIGIAIHEVGHLLGYSHSTYRSVMEFALSVSELDKGTLEFSLEERIQLPLRGYVIQIFAPFYPFYPFVANIIIALCIAPYFFIFGLALTAYLESRLNWKPYRFTLPLLFCLIVVALLQSNFFWTVSSTIFLLLMIYLISMYEKFYGGEKMEEKYSYRLVGYGLASVLIGMLCGLWSYDPAYVIFGQLMAMTVFLLVEINGMIAKIPDTS